MKHMNQAAKYGSPNQNLITPDQAADHLNVSVRSLAKWRSTGENNIPYSKIGRCVRYRLSDLEAYIEKHSHNVGG